MSNSLLSLKPSDLKNFLVKAINNDVKVLLTGSPGVGKTDIIKQSCTDCGADIVFSHASIEDPTNSTGLPWIHEGKADFIPFGDLRRLIDAKKKTVYFMDDLGQAPPLVQASKMQIMHGGQLAQYTISPNVVCMGATNRKQDKAAAQGILETVKSRFHTIIEMKPDANDWVKWALTRDDIPIDLVTFIRWRPDLLDKFEATTALTNSSSPRTVHHLGQLMLTNPEPSTQFAVYSGAVGEGFAGELIAYLDIYKNLPDPDYALMHPTTVDLPENTPSHQYALCGAIANRATPNNMDRFVKLINRMPEEFAVLATTIAINKSPELQQTTGFINWCANHGDIL